jgi:hypothetical protein
VAAVRGTRARILAGLAVTMLLAGCTSSSQPGGAAAIVIEQTAADPLVDENRGALTGLVLDEEARPLAAAAVALLPGFLTTKSAQDGGYTISLVEPGRYTVHASLLGYRAPDYAVEIRAGEVTQLHLTLEPIPVVVPRFQVVGPYDGFAQCYMSTPSSSGPCGFLPVVGSTPVTSIWTNNKNSLEFRFTGDDWQQIVFEARWVPSTAATNPKMNMIFSYTNRTSTHWFADAGASLSPIKFTYVRGETGPGGQLPGGQPREPNANLTLRTWLTLPFGTASPSNFYPVNVAYEMRFHLVVTVFYSMDAPEEYTAFEA